MNRWWWSIGALLVVVCCCATLGLTAIFTALDSSTEPGQLACLGAGDPAALAALDDEQLANGVLVVEVGMDLETPPRAWVIAVATAMQESGLRNLPHLGEKNDHDSLGLFQQRPSQGWGTPEQIMDPVYAATVFYERLLEVEGWEQMPLTVAAQAVQRSAFPDAYARHEPLAVALVNSVTGGVAGAAAFAPDLRCAGAGEVTAAGWARPVPGEYSSGFRTANRPDHYGIDTTDARGTVVRAAADGTVVLVDCDASLGGAPYSCDVDGSPGVRGCGWYLDILHAGGVVTRYCHLLARPDVTVGDRVAAGQPIGRVGSSGHSSGPHLHFEVELRTILSREAGEITVERRQTDPVPFLAARGITMECVSTPVDCQPAHGDRVRVERRPG
ncbi:MAG TPA: M23 family metallopeptidase [Natronosporangium sp.]|nr:M23 family metallopeptidase [Natronosporangium sp.]